MTASNSLPLLRVESYLDDRRRLSRDEFLKKHPHPILVIALTPEGGALEDEGAFRTRVVTSELARDPLAYTSRQAAVVAVEKRMDDAFQAFIWVGRESRCDVSLPFESVSKLQAQFVRRPSGELELSDAGSTNGTFVEGTRLEKNKPVVLRDASRLRFGKIDARFRSAEGFWEELGRLL